MALSDYGPTQHTLPTLGSAKFSSGLGVKDFIISISYNELSKKGVAKLGKSSYLLSNFENLIGPFILATMESMSLWVLHVNAISSKSYC